MGVAELIGTAAAAMAAAMVTLLSDDTRDAGVLTTSDPELPTAVVLGNVLRHGVRLQEFTGIPHSRLDRRDAVTVVESA